MGMYDLETHAWTSLPPMAVGRRDHAAVAVDGKIYVWGGDCYDVDIDDDFDGESLASGELYDPVMNCWTSLPSMNKGRSNFALVVLGGNIWAIDDGGDLEIFDPLLGLW